jgi:large subunit ribosomal protein L6
MSRVGKKPITIPDKTKVTLKKQDLLVEGPKGKLSRTIHDAVSVNIDGDTIHVTVENESKNLRALQGLTRSLIQNMITGVTSGFDRVLEINGIGYRASASGNVINLSLGYSHPIDFSVPEGVSVTVEKNNIVRLSSIDKEQLGHVAAAIRRLRPPEPYKGKGVKYAEEYIRRKAGKTGTA